MPGDLTSGSMHPEGAEEGARLDARRIALGIAPIGWTNDDMPELGGDIPFERCIGEMAHAGYTGCEIGNKFPRDPAVLARALAEVGLSVAGAWYSLYASAPERRRESLEGFARHVDFLAALPASDVAGTPAAIVCECTDSVQQEPAPVFAARPRFDEDAVARLAEGLEQAGEIARRGGLHLVYHPHLGTGIQDRDEIDRLMAATDPELVSLLLDSGHLHCAGVDPARLLVDHARRVRHIHLKDVRPAVLDRVVERGSSFLDAVREGLFTVPGDGGVDFVPILRAIGEVGYEGWLVVEAEQDPELAEPLEYAQMARSYLREAAGL